MERSHEVSFGQAIEMTCERCHREGSDVAICGSLAVVALDLQNSSQALGYSILVVVGSTEEAVQTEPGTANYYRSERNG